MLKGQYFTARSPHDIRGWGGGEGAKGREGGAGRTTAGRKRGPHAQLRLLLYEPEGRSVRKIILINPVMDCTHEPVTLRRIDV